MVSCSIMQAINGTVDLTRKHDRGAAIRFIASKGGQIVEIYGVEEARKIVGIHEISGYKKVGHEVNRLESSNDRIKHIIASADTAKEAIDICEYVALEWTVEPLRLDT